MLTQKVITRLLLLFLFIGFSIIGFSQSKYQIEINQINTRVVDGNHLYFSISKKHQDSTWTHLVKTDMDLNVIWHYPFENDYRNVISSIELYDDKIYVVSVEGKKLNSSRWESVKLSILSKDGKLENEHKLTHVGNPRTRLIKTESEIVIAYVSYLNSLHVERFNLERGEFIRSDFYSFEHIQLTDLLLLNDKVFVLGSLWKNGKSNNFMKDLSDPGDNDIGPVRDEGFLIIEYEQKGDVVNVVSVCNQYVQTEPRDRFLTITHFNSKGKMVRTKKQMFSDLGWTQYWRTHASGIYDWHLVSKGSELYLDRLNEKGRVVRSIKIDEPIDRLENNYFTVIDSCWYHFATDGEKIVVQSVELKE